MTTRFLARLLGLWIVLCVGGMVANREATIEVLNGFFASPALMWTTGVFMLLLGLGLVLSHNHWSGGAVPIIVTLYGWAILLKGLMFVLLPASFQTSFYQALHFEQFLYAYFVIALVLGGYLIYGGFKPEPGAH